MTKRNNSATTDVERDPRKAKRIALEMAMATAARRTRKNPWANTGKIFICTQLLMLSKRVSLL
jgi:hypothetical protein